MGTVAFGGSQAYTGSYVASYPSETIILSQEGITFPTGNKNSDGVEVFHLQSLSINGLSGGVPYLAASASTDPATAWAQRIGVGGVATGKGGSTLQVIAYSGGASMSFNRDGTGHYCKTNHGNSWAGGGLFGSYVWTTVPKPVKSVTRARATGSLTYSVTVGAAADNGGSAVTSVNFQYSFNGGAWSSTVSLGANGGTAAINVDSSHAGQTMNIRAWAVNANGNSQFLNAAATVIPSAPGAPPKPTVNVLGPGSIAVYGDQPSDNGNATLGLMDMRWSTNGGSTWTERDNVDNPLNAEGVDGLPVGATVIAQSRTRNDPGFVSPWSASSAAVTLPDVPDQVTGLDFDWSGTTSGSLSWGTPANNGDAIDSYQVDRQTNGGSWTTIASADAASPLAVTGLTAGTTYGFRVRAKNGAGFGPFSSTYSTSSGTAPATPNAPSASVTSDTTVRLTWTAPSNGGSSLTAWGVYRSDDGGSTWTTLTEVLTGTTLAYTVQGLAPASTHRYRIRARNAIGWSAYSAATGNVTQTSSGTTAPTIVDTDYASTSREAINIDWAKPSTNAKTVDHYTAQYAPHGSTSWVTFYTGTALTANTPKLAPFTQYDFRVVVTYTDSSQVASSTVSASTDADSSVRVYADGAWHRAIPYIRVGGAWKRAATNYVRASGSWKVSN